MKRVIATLAAASLLFGIVGSSLAQDKDEKMEGHKMAGHKMAGKMGHKMGGKAKKSEKKEGKM